MRQKSVGQPRAKAASTVPTPRKGSRGRDRPPFGGRPKIFFEPQIDPLAEWHISLGCRLGTGCACRIRITKESSRRTPLPRSNPCKIRVFSPFQPYADPLSPSRLRASAWKLTPYARLPEPHTRHKARGTEEAKPPPPPPIDMGRELCNNLGCLKANSSHAVWLRLADTTGTGRAFMRNRELEALGKSVWEPCCCAFRVSVLVSRNPISR